MELGISMPRQRMVLCYKAFAVDRKPSWVGTVAVRLELQGEKQLSHLHKAAPKGTNASS
jgi:hypothetical protein